MLQKHTLRLGACPERRRLRLPAGNGVSGSAMEIHHYVDSVFLSKGYRTVEKRKLRRIYGLPVVGIFQPSAVVQRKTGEIEPELLHEKEIVLVKLNPALLPVRILQVEASPPFRRTPYRRICNR